MDKIDKKQINIKKAYFKDEITKKVHKINNKSKNFSTIDVEKKSNFILLNNKQKSSYIKNQGIYRINSFNSLSMRADMLQINKNKYFTTHNILNKTESKEMNLSNANFYNKYNSSEFNSPKNEAFSNKTIDSEELVKITNNKPNNGVTSKIKFNTKNILNNKNINYKNRKYIDNSDDESNSEIISPIIANKIDNNNYYNSYCKDTKNETNFNYINKSIISSNNYNSTKKSKNKQLDNISINEAEYFLIVQNSLKKKCSFLFNTFYPFSSFKLIWDLIALLFLIYQSFEIPYRLSFNVTATFNIFVLELIQTVFFLIDILFNFNTGIVLNGVLVMNRKKIAITYLKTWFIFDIIASFPYDLFILGRDYFNVNIYSEDKNIKNFLSFNKLNSDIALNTLDKSKLIYKYFKNIDYNKSILRKTQIIKLIRLLKITKFIKLLRLIRLAKLKPLIFLIEDAFNSKLISVFIEMIKITSLMLIFAHWLACIWFAIGISNNSTFYSSSREDISSNYLDIIKISFKKSNNINNAYSWIDLTGIRDSDLHTQYIYSIYFIIVSITTVGFGDVTAVNNTERIFVAILLLVSGLVFSIIMGRLSALLTTLNEVENIYIIKMLKLREELNNKNMSNDIKDKILSLMEYEYNRPKDYETTIEMLKMLNTDLYNEVAYHINSNFVKTFTILNNFNYIHHKRSIDSNTYSKNKYLNNFNNNLLRFLIKYLKEEVFFKKEIIYSCNCFSDNIYFLQSGEVRIYIEEIDLIVKEYTNCNSIFGEVEFFGGYNRRFSCESNKLTKVNTFSYDCFRKSCSELMIYDYEEFIEFKYYINEVRRKFRIHQLNIITNDVNMKCTLQSNIFQNPDISNIISKYNFKFYNYNSCYLCDSEYHLADVCPLILDIDVIKEMYFRCNIYYICSKFLNKDKDSLDDIEDLLVEVLKYYYNYKTKEIDIILSKKPNIDYNLFDKETLEENEVIINLIKTEDNKEIFDDSNNEEYSE